MLLASVFNPLDTSAQSFASATAGPSAALAPEPLSFDWGGALHSGVSTAGYGQRFGVVNDDRAALWLLMSHVDDRVVYQYDLAVSAGLDAGVPLAAIDRATLRVELPLFPTADAVSAVVFGRLRFVEPTGYVVDHAADGLQLTVDLPWLQVSAATGFLGSLWKQTNEVVLSAADVADLADPAVFLAPPRLLAGVQLTTFDVARQDITLFGIAQLDLRPAGDTVDTSYVGAQVAGRLLLAASGLTLHHTTFLDLVIIDDSAVGGANPVALAGGSELTVALGEPLFWRATGGAVVASGAGGSLVAYQGLTSPETGVVFASRYENLVRLALSGGLRPLAGSAARWLSDLETLAAARIYLRPALDPDPVLGLDPGSANYYGTELELAVTLIPLSDLRAAASFGTFLPNGDSPRGFFELTVELEF